MNDMKQLLGPGIECTDPDQLQFCLKLSNTKFWYCQPNLEHDKLCIGANTPEKRIYERYEGNPKELLADAATDPEVRAFVLDETLWYCGSIDISEIEEEDVVDLLKTYGYDEDNPLESEERNQIICENYFEQNQLDFRNDT